MTNLIRAGIDAAVAVVLAAVLLLVYWVDQRGFLRPSGGLDDGGSGVVSVPPEPPKPPAKLRLAVTPGTYDNMATLLEGLGEGYRFETVDEASLSDPEECRRFAAIFLTCTEVKHPEATGGAPATPPPLAGALREFVAQGGTLYASDLQYDTLAAAFEEFVERKSVALGEKAERVLAEVVDPDLREALGPEMPLRFDQENWRPAAFSGPKVTVYLRGSFKIKGGVTIEAPLLVKFPHGKGTVIFTSFHNEKVNSELEPKLLNYLVLSTVTAGVESRTTQEMVRGGFRPKTTSLLSATPGDPVVKRTFQHAKAGKLKFTLGFEDRGGVLRLDVVSPDGKKEARRGGSTVTIDVPDAAPGPWQCIATAETLPYPNFPFTLTVGEPAVVANPSPSLDPRRPDETAGATVQFQEVPVVAAARTRSGPPRLGVTEPQFDDMGKLLTDLGEGYQYKKVSDDDLINPPALDELDILFLTCGVLPKEWAESKGGEAEPRAVEGDRKGVATAKIRDEIRAKIGETLRRFVTRGGTLYASDYRAGPVYLAFADHKPLVTPNLAILPQVELAERKWIEARAPATRVGTVAEALHTANLTPEQQNEHNFNLLVAVVENSSLVDGGLAGLRGNAVKMVAGELAVITPPLPDADVAAIAKTLVSWEKAIQDGYQSRTQPKKAKAQPAIEKALRSLTEVRDRIFNAGKGHGPQTVIATIVDPGLREALRVGETIPLNFDNNAWYPARFRGDDVTVLMEGEFKQTLGDKDKAPLLVKFPFGLGTVIFTSFHNEKVNNELETKLLKFLVFTAVTAKEEAVAAKEMLKGGFSQTKRDLNSHTPGNESVPSSYRSTKSGPLRFALTFSGEGARLKFTLVAPNGRDKFEKEVESTVIVETTDAPAGEWTYTVTALKVPFVNFPFTVSVGEVTPTPKAP